MTLPPVVGDGSDLYLPIRVGKEGFIYDFSEIGNVEADSSGSDTYTGSVSNTTNRIIADGSQYLTAGYSPLGIPYSRLQSKYWVSSVNQPRYGTGLNFVSSYIQAASTSNLFFL